MSVPAGSSRSPAEEALDRMEERAAGSGISDEDIATVRAELEWLTEERDAYMKGNLWVREAAKERERAESAEAEVRRLTEALRDGVDCVEAYHGTEVVGDGCAVCIWLERARALLADSPPDGEGYRERPIEEDYRDSLATVRGEIERQREDAQVWMTVVPSDKYEREKLRAEAAEAEADKYRKATDQQARRAESAEDENARLSSLLEAAREQAHEHPGQEWGYDGAGIHVYDGPDCAGRGCPQCDALARLDSGAAEEDA